MLLEWGAGARVLDFVVSEVGAELIDWVGKIDKSEDCHSMNIAYAS